MKPILWLDAQILRFFNKIAKDFNWLTGKDNFFLARASLLIVLLGEYVDTLYNKLDFLPCVTIIFGFYVWLIQRTSLEDRLRNVKDIKLHLELTFNRLFLILFFVFSAVCGYFSLPWFRPSSYLGMMVFGAGSIFVLYFVSLDQPPFKKSQAWQKIKEWFGSGVMQPQLEPIPVRSN